MSRFVHRVQDDGGHLWKRHDSLSVCPAAACHCVLTTNLILCQKFHLRDIRHVLDEGAWLVKGDKSNMGNVVLHYRGAELRMMNAYLKLQDPEFRAPHKRCIQRLVLCLGTYLRTSVPHTIVYNRQSC